MRVLIVEDNIEIAKIVKKTLKANGFEIDHAETIKDGQYKAESNEYDVMVLDLNLPDGYGLDLVKILRDSNNSTPIIILTVQGSVQEKVEGLNSGADDYLLKPFSMDELMARIRTLTRRQRKEKRPVIYCGEVKLDQLAHEVYCGEKKLDLVKKEFSLLEHLIINSGNVVTRPQLWEHVWGLDDYPLNNTVDVHIASLRRKIKEVLGKDVIKTVRGMGYKLEL